MTDSRSDILTKLKRNHPAHRPLPEIPRFEIPGEAIQNFVAHLKGFDGESQLFAGRNEAIAWLTSHINPEGKKVISSVEDFKGNVTFDDYKYPTAGSGPSIATAGSGPSIATAGSGPSIATAGSSPSIATAGSGPSIATAGSGPSIATAGSSPSMEARMHDIDICVGEAILAVGETGSLLVDSASLGNPAAALFSTDLYLLVDRDTLIDGLQDAYAKIDLSKMQYSSFFSGPSATADIEAVHITGAQGEISLTALIYNCTPEDIAAAGEIMHQLPQGTPLGQPSAPELKLRRPTDLSAASDSV